MFTEFELTVTGGFAIATLMLWAAFAVILLHYLIPTKWLAPVRKAVTSLWAAIRPRKQQ